MPPIGNRQIKALRIPEAERTHPSRGGRAYSQDLRLNFMHLYQQNMDLEIIQA
jgi:hypothetical protein